MLCALPTEKQTSALFRNDGIRPRKAWYVLSLALFLISTAGIIFLLYLTITSFSNGTHFLVPGSLTVHVAEPGTYVLWDELSTVFQGKTYANSVELPGGLEIKIREVQTGHFLQIASSLETTENIGQAKRRSIGTILFDRAGTYVIDVTGNFPERIFYLRRSLVSSVFRSFAMLAILGFIGWIIAPIMALIVFLIRANALKLATQQSTGTAPDARPSGIRLMDAKEEKTFAMFCHLGALSGYVIPFGNIIVPLILWIMKKEESPFINVHGKEALNFQISMLIYSIFSLMLVLIIIGIFLLAALWIFNLVIVIIAGVRASSGEQFRYPCSIRFIK